jgi:hypothetical protein
VVKLGFDNMQAIECLTKEDLKKSPILPGHLKVLLKAVSKLGEGAVTKSADVNDIVNNVSVSQEGVAAASPLGIQGVAGVNLTAESAGAAAPPMGIQGLAGINPTANLPPVTGNFSWHDPQIFLKALTSTKSTCYNIVDFVEADPSNSERIISVGDDVELVCRSGTKKPKLEHINLAQWSTANMAILHKLVGEGTLAPANIFDYIAYTSFICKLWGLYDPVSVLCYDREYRKIQNVHKFRWGTMVDHLVPTFLKAKSTTSSASATSKSSFNSVKQITQQGDRQSQNRGNVASHTPAGKVICRRFNGRNGCSMRGCRFEHVCSAPGCAKPHPGWRHSDDSKNV